MKIPDQVKKVHSIIDKELPMLLKNGNDFDIMIKGNCSSVWQVLTYIFSGDEPKIRRLWIRKKDI